MPTQRAGAAPQRCAHDPAPPSRTLCSPVPCRLYQLCATDARVAGRSIACRAGLAMKPQSRRILRTHACSVRSRLVPPVHLAVAVLGRHCGSQAVRPAVRTVPGVVPGPCYMLSSTSTYGALHAGTWCARAEDPALRMLRGLPWAGAVRVEPTAACKVLQKACNRCNLAQQQRLAGHAPLELQCGTQLHT
jgi:hypothetical protein